MKLFIIMIIVGYFLISAYIYISQDSKIFNFVEISNQKPIKLKNVKHISLKISDSIVLDGVYKKASRQNAPLVIYFGGNSDDATRFLLYVEGLDGYDIVTFNYRGFVNSSGKPTQKALFSDALTIYDKFSKGKEVIITGRSLGTGVALYLASKRDCKGVVLITPYDSILSLARGKYPFLPISLLLRYKFESVKYIGSVKAPISVILVENDATIPRKNSDRLISKIKNLDFMEILSNTTHAEVLTHPQFEKTIQKILKRFYVK